MAKSAGRNPLQRAALCMSFGAVLAGAGLFGPLQAARAQGARVDLGQEAVNLLPPRMLMGDWLTIVRTSGRPQPARLQIHTMEPGKTAGKLIYSSPRRCIIDLEYGGSDGDKHIFYIVPFTNCFGYKTTDYIAITAVGSLAAISSDLTQRAKDYQRMNKEQKASAGTSASDADPEQKMPAGAEAPNVKSMRYRISLGGRFIEDGLLDRQ